MKSKRNDAQPANNSKSNVRAVAASAITQLLRQNGSLTSQLQDQRNRSDFPLLQEICFGTCRHFFSLEFILLRLLSKPLRNKDLDVKSMLLVGLYQLRHMSLPDYAVIDETVSAIGSMKKPWAKGLTNGVLRNYLREKDRLEKELCKAGPHVKLDQPLWLTERLKKDWPGYWEQILKGSSFRPPMTLRVNLSKIGRGEYLQLLEMAELSASTGPLANSAIYLHKPVAVDLLPGFHEGLVSVQDEASQLIPPLLQLKPDQRVLDACAAPGGKTCHILESEHSLTSMVSLDIAEPRLLKVKQNLSRLGLEAETVAADANKLDQWWDGEQFDRILLDAPCSATGVIRRHPDIKILRTPSNLSELGTTQLQLLESIWECLRPGGLLLYTTCSVLPAENQEIVAKFLESADNAKYEGIEADWGVECPHGRQLLPQAANGPDGFFFSLLRKA